MKAMKGKFIKKLKSANKPIAYFTPDKILHVSNNLDTFVDNFKGKLIKKLEKLEKTEKNEQVCQDDKENVVPFASDSASVYDDVGDDDDDVDEGSFSRPDMETGLLFDPKLLSAFAKAVSAHIRATEAVAAEKAEAKASEGLKQKCSFFEPDPLSEPSNQPDPLLEYDDKCPPGGGDSVIFYTTSLRGIRKTFEDCQNIRFLLESFGVVYYERDVSVHSDYREELWKVMGERVLPPRLFIRGRYVGGSDKVLTLHEQGKLRELFRDIPIDFRDAPCNVCCGLRFMLCYRCDGSRKVFEYEDEREEFDRGVWVQCLQCNENGLVVCPLC